MFELNEITGYTLRVFRCFDHLCGEYYTSSAFAAWLGAMIIKTGGYPESIIINGLRPGGSVNNVLIYNQTNNTNHALTLLSAC